MKASRWGPGLPNRAIECRSARGERAPEIGVAAEVKPQSSVPSEIHGRSSGRLWSTFWQNPRVTEAPLHPKIIP